MPEARFSAARTAARRRLLGGASTPSVKVDAAMAVSTRQLNDAFVRFCKATVELGAHTQTTVDSWKVELASVAGGDAAAQYAHTAMMLDRLFRGCRVRVTEQRLHGCEGLVLLGDRLPDGRLPVRVTLQDGTESVRSLRPIHLQLVQGRREAEEHRVPAKARLDDAAQHRGDDGRDPHEQHDELLMSSMMSS